MVNNDIVGDIFGNAVSKLSGVPVVATACPLCGSTEIGYDMMEKRYDCFGCNKTFKF